MAESSDLLNRIANGFPKWDPKSTTFIPGALTESEAARLRGSLFHLDPDFALRGIGASLYFIASRGGRMSAEDESFIELMVFLDATLPSTPPDRFEWVNRERAGIIASFLEEAQTWPCFSYCRPMFRGMIDFWKRQAGVQS